MNQINFSDYYLPRFHEIPNVGLYLKQVVTFINEATESLTHTPVTTTMLSNYVKLHLVSSPVKKMYNREQIATLVIIVLFKNVLSLDNIREFLSMQQEHTEVESSYNYFCDKLEGMLKQVSGEELNVFPEEDLPVDQYLLKHIIITLVQKIHLDECFRAFATEEEKNGV